MNLKQLKLIQTEEKLLSNKTNYNINTKQRKRILACRDYA